MLNRSRLIIVNCYRKKSFSIWNGTKYLYIIRHFSAKYRKIFWRILDVFGEPLGEPITRRWVKIQRGIWKKSVWKYIYYAFVNFNLWWKLWCQMYSVSNWKLVWPVWLWKLWNWFSKQSFWFIYDWPLNWDFDFKSGRCIKNSCLPGTIGYHGNR